MNNVQSGIIYETMSKERKARDKWIALYGQQFGPPLSQPSGDDHPTATLLPGPTIRIRQALPTQLAYVPSAYQVADQKELSGAATNGKAAAAPVHHAPYAYAETGPGRDGKRIASGPLNSNTDLYVRGDNTIVNAHTHVDSKHSQTGRAFNHGGMPAAGIKTRPPQQLLTHTKAKTTVAGTLAPNKNKIGAATAAQLGAEAGAFNARPQTPSQPVGATAGATEPLAGGGAASNGQSSGAPPATETEIDASPRPLSATVKPSQALNATLSASARSSTQRLSATQLSQHNPVVRAAMAKEAALSARLAPSSPSVVAQKAQALYLALGFKVANSDQRGVLVTKVDPESAAERCGLKQNDLLAYVNSKPTRSVDEYHAVIAHAHGMLHLVVRRRGVNQLKLQLKL